MFWRKSKTDISLSLVVIEAYSRDVGGKVGRIYKGDMKTLKVSEGDLLEIYGKSKIIVKCKETYPSDEGRGIIRLDASDRIKAQVEFEETIAARKTTMPEAQKIVLKPLVETDPFDESILSYQFLDTPLMKGEIVSVRSVAHLVVTTVPVVEAVLCTKNTAFYILEP